MLSRPRPRSLQGRLQCSGTVARQGSNHACGLDKAIIEDPLNVAPRADVNPCGGRRPYKHRGGKEKREEAPAD